MSKYNYDCTDCKYGKVDLDKEPCNSCGHDNGNWEPAEITEADTASDADVGSVRRRVLEQAIKYICRAGKKSPDTEAQDLRKAVWYLNREIERLEAPHENH